MFSCNSTDCTNGVQDGNETGIDCGGDCPNCLSSPTPTPTPTYTTTVHRFELTKKDVQECNETQGDYVIGIDNQAFTTSGWGLDFDDFISGVNNEHPTNDTIVDLIHADLYAGKYILNTILWDAAGNHVFNLFNNSNDIVTFDFDVSDLSMYDPIFRYSHCGSGLITNGGINGTDIASLDAFDDTYFIQNDTLFIVTSYSL